MLVNQILAAIAVFAAGAICGIVLAVFLEGTQITIGKKGSRK